MTEKRFYIDDYGVINDKEYEFSVLDEDELVNIINGIVEENKELKEENKEFFEKCGEEYPFTELR